MLNLFNKKSDQYERVKLMWGDEGINIEDNTYVIDGFYRISQHSDDKGCIVFTFYEDTSYVVDFLKADALLRLKINRGNQKQR